MRDAVAAGELTTVDLALIDDPKLPARASIDDEHIASLAASIRAVGLLQPIGLKRTGERYEVVYGHCRRLACQQAQLLRVPAMIYTGDLGKVEAAKLHENTKRKELGAAEEAVYFAELLETVADGDFEKLCELLEETPAYVNVRFDLLRGDQRVFDTLHRGEINLEVAKELNRIKDEGQRANLLGVAVSQGAKARQVREWRHAAERSAAGVGPSTLPADGSSTPIVQTGDDPMGCFFCGSRDDFHQKLLVYIDPYCLKAVERIIGFELRHMFRKNGDAPDAPPPSA